MKVHIYLYAMRNTCDYRPQGWTKYITSCISNSKYKIHSNWVLKIQTMYFKNTAKYKIPFNLKFDRKFTQCLNTKIFRRQMQKCKENVCTYLNI